ncbi:MAG: alkaline phosphatase family protein, partial [Anaerolineae bacterium]|nr:alkaline phosphatase family protein [Anaerolineae bacterium]
MAKTREQTAAAAGQRVFAIGLDGATLDLIRPWAAEGRLPTFARIMSEGSCGRLISTIPPVTGPAWASFMTGKNPGKHGVGDFFHRVPGEYRRVPIDATSLRAEPLWVTISRLGKKVGVLNVPVTYPPYEVDGFVVSGLLTPRSGARFTYPESLAQELDQALGGYRVNLDHFYSKGAAEPFLADVRNLVDGRTRAAQYLMSRYDWDFFMVHYIATDWIQHFLWHCMDRAHPQFDETEAALYGDAILQTYQQVDAALDTLLSSLDRQTVVLLVSDHGFGPFHHYLYLNNWLLQNGLLHLRRSRGTRLRYLLFRRGITPSTLYQALDRMALVKLAFKASKQQRSELMGSLFLSARDIDWPRTRAYSAGNVGQVFLNVKGREPSGIVEPGAEYEELREQIISMLAQLRDPQTGELVVEHIYRREEIYNGPYVEQMADILLLPRNMEYGATGLSEFVSNSVIAPSFSYSGSHRMDGVFMLMGEGVQRGVDAADASILDMAPTVLYLLGLPVSRDMDGRVLTEVLEEGLVSARPVCYKDEDAGAVA